MGAPDACSAAQQVGTYVSSIAGLHSTVVQFSHTGHVTFSAVFIYFIDLSGSRLLYGKMSKIGKRAQETSKTVKKRQILNVLTGDAIVLKSQKHLFAY